MKLDRWMTGAFAAAAVALACGCSSAPSAPVKTASAATSMDPLGAPGASAREAVGITNLMSAELSGPAPRVGKAHLAVDDDGLDTTDGEQPKEARRSDGSRRGGAFGSSK